MMHLRLYRRLPLLAVLALLPAACGDPLVVLGDAPGYMRVVAGIADSAGARIDPLATRTRLTEPAAIAFQDESALLFVADRGATRTQQGITTRVARIMSVTSAGQLTLLLDGGGCAGGGACLVDPVQLAPAGDGTLLIADATGNRIFRFHPVSRALTVVAGNGSAGLAPDGTPATQAPLDRPGGVAVGDDGAIYFTETGNHRVRRIDPAGTLRTVAGTGVPSHSGDGGAALGATLNSPTGVAYSRGTLYVAESGAHAVRAIELASGTISTVAGSLAQGFSGDGGPAAQARLASPRGLAVTADGGTLFIADRDNHRVRAVNLGAGTISTLAGTGATQYVGGRQPAGQTSLRLPTAVAASSRGFLFIADTGHQIVWRASLTL